jgi:hypothetical protein
MPKAAVNRYRVARIRANKNKRAKLWDAMRMLPHFTAGDLLAVCELTSRHSVLTFIGQLRRAGFAAVAFRGNEAVHEQAAFRLIRNTGPTAPALITRAGKPVGLFDLNTDQEHHFDCNR